jgi:WD repeat-containing protein 48
VCGLLRERKLNLSGERTVKIRKLAQYLVEKLNIELPPLPSLSDPNSQDKDTKVSPNQRILPESYFQFYCNDKLLSPTTTLATVRTFYWKSSGDMVITYKINDSYALLPLKRAKK